MEASSTVVIKVKYGDVIRRFNAVIADDKLSLNIAGLREKILSLFSFAHDTDMMLTYCDEDGDAIALVDDDDLRDVVKQGLNPVRVTVKVNSDKISGQTPTRSRSQSPVQPLPPLPNLDAVVSEILRSAPLPVRETVLRFSADLASKASSSSPPDVLELVDNLSKVILSSLGQASDSNKQDGAPKSSSAADYKDSEPLNATAKSDSNKQDGAPKSSSAADYKDSEPLNATAKSEKVKAGASMKKNEVKMQNVTEPRALFDFNAVAAALESQKDIPKPESNGASDVLRRKEKAKKNAECSNVKSHVANDNVEKVAEPVDINVTGKDVGSSSAPQHVNGVLPTDRVKSAVIDAFKKATTPTWSPALKKATTPTWSPYKDSANFGSIWGPNSLYECPFSVTPLETISSVPPYPAADVLPYRRSNSQNDSSGNIFHRGVRCDGCGIHPIVGPRFKSKIKEDYDLCSVCFDQMGDVNGYVRMDRPGVYRHQLPHFRGVRDMMVPHGHRGSKAKYAAVKLDSRFIQDVNIFDGTVMAPLVPFTKIWRMRNNGILPWPKKTQLVWIGGDKLSETHCMEVQVPDAGLKTDQELDVAIDFISPELPGRYISYWRMASPSGQKFGQRVWVLIQVDASTVKESPRDSVRNLNLNLPPASSSLADLGIISVDPEPVAEPNLPNSVNSEKTVESILPPNSENELKFPINDSLLVGNGAGSSPDPSSAYRPVDIHDEMAIPLVLPPPPTAVQNDALGKDLMEDRLLMELEMMGFKEVGLNKEVLRMNEYNLEKSVDDLCGVAEWDPILEELQEMGFNDTEVNKKLLKKNNGSIKRVVMDLIAGEGDV